MGDVGDATHTSDYPEDIDTFRLEYFKSLVEAAPINGHRTFWYIHEGKTNRTSPSYFAGYAIDLEEVKSIIVYDSPWIYETFPGLTDLLTTSEIRYITGEDELIKKFAPGLYVVDIELNPARKRRTITVFCMPSAPSRGAHTARRRRWTYAARRGRRPG